MKKEVAEKMFKETGIKYIPKYKKIWYSITKYERYPEMATEGVGRAIGYLSFLILLFSIILACFTTYKLSGIINDGITYLDQNIEIINYDNGSLNLKLKDNVNEIKTEDGYIYIDTSDSPDENYIKELKNKDFSIICLKENVTIKTDGETQEFKYKDALEKIDITKFGKSEFIEFIKETINTPKAYVAYFVLICLATFVGYFIITLLNVILLSIFGVLTALITRMRIRYRAIFNMSIYSITISTILQLIYFIIQLYVDFEIKYFDLMYTAIAYICLAAAIFMIKSDVVKQQMEMIKLQNEKKEKEEQEVQDKEDKQEDNKEEKKEEKKEKEDTTSKEKKEDLENNAEGEGSNA